MKKTVQVEYVGIEDIQEIMDDAYAVMKLGNYVGIEFHSLLDIPRVRIKVMLGKWNGEKLYDYDYTFSIDDNEENVALMNSCKNALKNLLVEE